MLQSMEFPDCIYGGEAVMIPPSAPTPKHYLYLSNLDDQKFLRFSIKYLYLFNKSLSFEIFKSSLARVLVHYYPLAGRLMTVDDHKLQVDCNGQGAVFAEASMDTTVHQLLQSSNTPNKSWNKFFYRVQAQSFIDVPPLVVQVTSLSCGGMILCTAINHCLCDGIGTSQFLHAWAELTRKPESDLTIVPSHWRHVLKPREPAQVKFRHAGFTAPNPQVDLLKYLQSQPVVPVSLTFTPSLLLRLKKHCVPSLKCTSFETLAAHTWRSWIRSLNQSLPSKLVVKLLFSVNVRAILDLPNGYYGNGFILACAESTVEELVEGNLSHAVKLVQEAKARLKDEEYIRSTVDLLEDKTVKMDLSTSLVISQWSKLGLEDVDFGEGKPLHMGPLTSDIYCLFLPVTGDSNINALRVLVSVPQTMVEPFQYHMNQKEENEDAC